MKNFSEALSDLNTDVEVNPNKLEAYQARADLWCETEDYVNAIEDYTACLAIVSSRSKQPLTEQEREQA